MEDITLTNKTKHWNWAKLWKIPHLGIMSVTLAHLNKHSRIKRPRLQSKVHKFKNSINATFTTHSLTWKNDYLQSTTPEAWRLRSLNSLSSTIHRKPHTQFPKFLLANTLTYSIIINTSSNEICKDNKTFAISLKYIIRKYISKSRVGDITRSMGQKHD